MRTDLYQLIFILLLKAVFLLGFIAAGLIELGPDEAQYWTWSKMLDLGYYSKPPAIAWQIAFGTNLFGDTEMGVRFGSLLLGFFIPIAIYFLSLAAGTKSSTAFWAALSFAVIPLGVLASILAITDTGFVLFWTLALIPLVKALRDEKEVSYPLIGALIGIGALFKWPIYYLWIFVLACWPRAPQLRSSKILLGIAISLLGLLPSLYWNTHNNWATFRHVTATLEGGSNVLTRAPGNFWAFLGEQFLLFSPILFILLAIAIKKVKDCPLPFLFLGAVSSISIALFLFLSYFQKMQGNWVDFAYSSAVVFLAWAALEKGVFNRRWYYAGVAFGAFLSIVALSIPFWAPYNLNPFKQNQGWNELSNVLKKVGYNPEKEFLFSDRYQNSSLLSFYAPSQKRSYFLNLNGIRNNQFSFWPGLKDEQMGNTGYYIAVEKPDKFGDVESYQKKLQPYFEKTEVKGIFPLVTSDGDTKKALLVIKGEGYNGKEPARSDLY